MSRGVRKIAWLLSWAVVAACGSDDNGGGPVAWPDGVVAPDVGLVLDGRRADIGSFPDGLPTDSEGPDIEIVSPLEGQTVIGDLIRVTATITDEDGVDDQTVELTLQGQEPVAMSITDTPNVYEALAEVSQYTDKVRLWVTASDLEGKSNTEVLNFARDPGPLIQVLSPAEDSRHKGSVSIQVAVGDEISVTSFEVRIGTVVLTSLTAKELGDNKQLYTGTIKFDDPLFNPSLSGKQVLTFSAENENGARASEQRIFFVDDVGPTITIQSQSAGDLIGGIIEIQAQVTDPAGVVGSSVRCVIGNNLDTREVQLTANPTTPNVYEGQFDTRTFTPYMLFPVMSFRAADRLGNEATQDIEVALDSGPPRLELDPPTMYFHARRRQGGGVFCSHPFDPVGPDAANDQQVVGQIQPFRVRIEDKGNAVPFTAFSIIAGVDRSSTKMFLLDDTSQALTIDTTGDGVCDSVNPAVVPLGSAPDVSQAVAIDLVGVPPAGSANFTPYTIDGSGSPTGNLFPLGSGCVDGEDSDPPRALCEVSQLTVATPAPVASGAGEDQRTEPAIYTIPPVVQSSLLKCLGFPFDFLANDFEDGWICVAASASDNLGNHGISRPLRVWVAKDWDGRSTVTPTSPAPNCTGTLDADTGQVDTSRPCSFRPVTDDFPQVYGAPFFLLLP